MTSDQVAAVRRDLLLTEKDAPRRDLTPIQAHVRAFVDAFVSETFDPQAFANGAEADAYLARFGAARIARFYEAVDSVLTTPQRASVVAILREHASYDPEGT